VPIGHHVILALKIAVGAVTVLLLASLTAVALGNRRLHGRINIVFFVLTVAALVVFEGMQFLAPEMFNYFNDPEKKDLRQMLRVHLCFSVPSALLLPVMLFSGLRRYRTLHLSVAALFGVLWAGTFVTGVFFLE
jgi:uncharacterized membrane protein YozB (DUF420 family)